MKYWTRSELTFWLPPPAQDQTLLTRMPSTHGPGMAKSTTEGPNVHLALPKAGLVLVGKPKTGPMPHTRTPGFLGERNSVVLMLPSPKVLPLWSAPRLGWLMRGMMVRVMRLKVPMWKGMTG